MQRRLMMVVDDGVLSNDVPYMLDCWKIWWSSRQRQHVDIIIARWITTIHVGLQQWYKGECSSVGKHPLKCSSVIAEEQVKEPDWCTKLLVPCFIEKHIRSQIRPPLSPSLTSLSSQMAMVWSRWSAWHHGVRCYMASGSELVLT